MTMTTTSTLTIAHAAEHSSPGQRFLDALTRRNFQALEALLADDVWLRALLPRHLDEHYGAGETGRVFRNWYGTAEAIEAITQDNDNVVGKERIRYSFKLRPQWAPDTWHVIEQMAFLSTRDGLIRKIDLVCTGFLATEGPSQP